MDWKIKQYKCPKCESHKTKQINCLALGLIGAGIFMTSIPFVIVIIGLFGIAIGGIMMHFCWKQKGKYICRDCKHTWIPGNNIRKINDLFVKKHTCNTKYKCHKCSYTFDGVKYPLFKWSYLCPGCNEKLSDNDILK